jgi:hypothetical protein
MKNLLPTKCRKNMKNITGFGDKIELTTLSNVAKNEAIYNDPDPFMR